MFQRRLWKMKKVLLIAFAVCLMASAAYAEYTVSYGWEDGVGTHLGYYGNVAYAYNVTGPVVGLICTTGTYTCPGAYEGDRYLQVAESPHSGTPQVYLACITGLVDGDSVVASYFGYDDSPDVSPSLRIWGHYSDAQSCPECPGNYTGSASGEYDYTAGTGWEEMYYVFYYAPPNTGDGLVIEGRLYSSPSTYDCTTDFFMDFITLTVPDQAHVLFPDLSGPSATENSRWGNIKALYR
jgi:hypothetical protein